jgi:epoxyqueuosine reductase
MSKFHSSISRRNFMKALGLGAAGFGAAVAATPVFHDLDELISSDNAVSNNPWWVKEQDKPTIDIDWSMVERHDGTSYHDTPEKVGYLVENRAKLTKQWAQEGKLGYGQRDLALWESMNFPFTMVRDQGWTGPKTMIGVHRPEDLGMPKYQGTPEENLRMLRAAIRFFGGSNAYSTPLDTNSRKCVKTQSRGVQYVFEDVDKAYETPEKKVIPNNCNNVLVWPLVQSDELNKRFVEETASYHNSTAVYMAYYRISTITHLIQRFVTLLGYQYLPDMVSGAGSFSTLAGCGELCRASFNCSPVYGTMVRVPTHAITDMQIAETKPVDAGIFEFCKSCQRCADVCPSGAVVTGDPSWDVHGPYNATGFYAWRPYYEKCLPYRGFPGGEFPSDCGMCQTVCVFSKRPEASIHEVVKATVAKTSIFNGFFTNMDRLFGYPDKDLDAWWDETHPVYGINSYMG